MSPNARSLLVLYLLIASVSFALLALVASRTPYFPIDLAITRFVQSYRNPALDTLMRLVGLSGYFPQTLVLNALIFLIILLCRMRRAALTIAVVGSLTGLSSTMLRYTIDRPRPAPNLVIVFQEIENRHYSFPSGHVVGFTAILGFLLYLGLTEVKPSWHRNLILFLYAAFIFLVGLSRIYVGEHWFSDVVGGYLYGSICMVLMILFYQFTGRWRGKLWRDLISEHREEEPEEATV